MEYGAKKKVAATIKDKEKDGAEIIEVEGTSLVKKAVGIFKCSR